MYEEGAGKERGELTFEPTIQPTSTASPARHAALLPTGGGHLRHGAHHLRGDGALLPFSPCLLASLLACLLAGLDSLLVACLPACLLACQLDSWVGGWVG